MNLSLLYQSAAVKEDVLGAGQSASQVAVVSPVPQTPLPHVSVVPVCVGVVHPAMKTMPTIRRINNKNLLFINNTLG